MASITLTGEKVNSSKNFRKVELVNVDVIASPNVFLSHAHAQLIRLVAKLIRKVFLVNVQISIVKILREEEFSTEKKLICTDGIK